jgi:hypothetical protein
MAPVILSFVALDKKYRLEAEKLVLSHRPVLPFGTWIEAFLRLWEEPTP